MTREIPTAIQIFPIVLTGSRQIVVDMTRNESRGELHIHFICLCIDIASLHDDGGFYLAMIFLHCFSSDDEE
jgi:hypothetical protein